MKIITASEAAQLVNDNAVIITSVDGMTAWPEEVAAAIGKRYENEGHPKNITSIHGAGAGDFVNRGENVWCHEGMMKKSISSFITQPQLSDAIADNKVMAWFYPLGTILQVFREMGRGMPGVMTKTGLGTFMDSRYGGGKLNKLTEEKGENLVEYIPDFLGEEYLFFKGWKADFGLMRVPVADKRGNLSCLGDVMDTETIAVAQAVKSCGGTVIVQADKLVEVGEINPRLVKVPGMYVDYVVLTEDIDNAAQNMNRTHSKGYNISFTGQEKCVLKEDKKKMPLSVSKVMARRVAQEVKEGNVVNLGIGMPTTVADIFDEEGCSDAITLISETGVIGGVPALGKDFGCHWNVEAFADHVDQFAFYDGGNLDFAAFGISEIDSKGNMNTTHLNGMIRGVGGFSNMAVNSKKSVFIGSFTANGLETELKDGKITVIKEGTIKKFVKECFKVTFVSQQAVKKGNVVLFVTDRCVMRCDERGIVIEEIAPGIDLQKDILDQMDFKPVIPEEGIKLMDPALFEEKWGGLRESIKK